MGDLICSECGICFSVPEHWLASPSPDHLNATAMVAILDCGAVAMLRLVSLSRVWWRVFAESLLKAPQALSWDAYIDAIATQQAARTTAQMLGAACAVEIGGSIG